MKLRPYQEQAAEAVMSQWQQGVRSTLLVLPTGTGKTIVFSKTIERVLHDGGRVLVLAHRHELLQQAADKLEKATGLKCGIEKAEETAVDSWFNVVVGSVQTMQKESRRTGHEFTHIIVDEAHHALSASYRAVLDHYPDAKVLGVTATADRGDKRNLGEVFETLAFDYPLIQAIKDGWLCKLTAMTIPLTINLTSCKQTAGDFAAADVGTALDPYLEQIADHLKRETADRKTVVFLPLIVTSQKFLAMLKARGINAREVNGDSYDRAETLDWFQKAGKGAVLCNAMLLAEGWDCPDVDCICNLRPTKIRSLYCQMVGRGTRIHPGKEDLRILDFLWHSERHSLMRPAHLVAKCEETASRVADLVAETSIEEAVDLLEAEEKAEGTATKEREESLRKLLAEQQRKKRQLVDPLQYELSIGARLKDYEPELTDLRAMGPPSDKQLKALEDMGIFTGDITCSGHASKLIETVKARRFSGLSTPKQIRFLEGKGFQEVGQWQMDSARKMIDRIAGNGWSVPFGIVPKEYKPVERAWE